MKLKINRSVFATIVAFSLISFCYINTRPPGVPSQLPMYVRMELQAANKMPDKEAGKLQIFHGEPIVEGLHIERNDYEWFQITFLSGNFSLSANIHSTLSTLQMFESNYHALSLNYKGRLMAVYSSDKPNQLIAVFWHSSNLLSSWRLLWSACPSAGNCSIMPSEIE